MRLPRVPSPTSGTIDVVLAALLAVLSVVLGATLDTPLGIALDLAACAAAAAASRWPRAGSVAVGVLTAGYLFAPDAWMAMGEYAGLIVILGAGMRGQQRVRLAMSIGYALVLAAIQVGDYGFVLTALLGSLIWVAMIAIMWLIGDAFTAIRRTQAQARAAALAQQRLSLARDLHDSLARSLVHLTLRARQAATSGDADALEPLADGISQASGELRWLLSALREPDSAPAITSGGSLATTLQRVIDDLGESGHPPTVTIDGNLDKVPLRVGEVVGAVALEAAANIQRHAPRGRPCIMVASVDAQAVDLAFINDLAVSNAGSGQRAMGLLGASERLAAVGGMLETRKESAQWITRITVPLREAV
ncbi:MAG: histidine kinase [Propionicimonas sp.]|uniref:sensor histidine kinase n=1 Tax=Propionicimonas sp. TaxID=1955623 RepID=UPI003D0F1179